MFATLWYAGAVMLTLGYSGTTLEVCNNLKSTVDRDIYNAYQNLESCSTLEVDGFRYEDWKVTCEPQRLD